jgi:hypothetical protein
MARRLRGQVTLYAAYTMHVETRRAGFLVEPQNQVGYGLSVVSPQHNLDGLSVVWPQNHWDSFGLKTTGMVFSGLDTKLVVMVLSGLASKPVARIS